MRPPLPPLLFFGCLAAGALVHEFLPMELGGYSFAMGMFAGSILLVVAFVIAASSIRELSRQGTTIDPAERPTRLVTAGPFRFSRNPMYLALVLVLAGIGVMANAMWFALGAILLLLLLDRLVVRREEIVVGGIFGADYAAYRARVRRWL